MKTLIKIESHNGNNVVSARELHALLNIKKDFTSWCKKMIGNRFEEGLDFTPVWVKSPLGRPARDYAFTLDTAKEISMLQRTERGKLARRHFIACEKQLQEQRMKGTGILELKAQYGDIAIARLRLNREAAKIRKRLRALEPPRVMVYLPMGVQKELFEA